MMPMTKDAVVVTVQVEAPMQRAFEVFTSKFGSWWPMEHHIGSQPAVDAVIEPHAGGRWYEVAADGSECEWGTVLEWEAPTRVVLAWQLNPEFEYEPDLALATQVEVRVVSEGANTTRVELEHRGFEVYGERGEAMRTAVSAPDGWNGIVQRYVAAAA
jgi:uncharacterized protein YndB with AHSA1/START domain